MIGILVQLTSEFAKIWSVSSHRLITYSSDDLPNDSHEGDWLNIKFDTSDVMRGITREDDWLKTKRDERAKLQVQDVFVVNSRSQEVYCETFGVVRIEESRTGGRRWTDDPRTKDHCIWLWMTISSTAQFFIEEQSLDRANSKDGKYAETYTKLMEEYQQIECRIPSDNKPDDYNEFDETILIVGHDPRTNVYFSSSQSGEAFINPGVWKLFDEGKSMEKCAVFRARLNKQYDNPMHKVLKLYERIELWDGVEINTERELSIELNAEVVEKRATCFALDTEPFGLVTYPFEGFLDTDINVGDHLRVLMLRFRDDMKDDYPSKWKVTRFIKMLKKSGKKEEEKEWFEAVVTSVTTTINALLTFKHGSALYNMNAYRDPLLLGDIVDIRVVPNSRRDGFFDIIDMGEETRKRNDLVVEPFERTKCTVFCIAEVIERCDSYFLLDTPIIGLVLFFFKEAPRAMKVGDVWRVKMLRRKDKKNFPSHWIATDIAGDYPLVSTESSRRKEEKYTVENTDTSDNSTRESTSYPSTLTTSQDAIWTTVIITGSDHKINLWFGTCPQADRVRITKQINQTGKDLRKGTFYRVKLSMRSGGQNIAHFLDPEQVYPKDIDVEIYKERIIRLWCYSRIVEERESSFTVNNYLIGDATLPFNRANREMRVGDDLETLYYRVKDTNNPTHWMVQEAKFTRRNTDHREEEGDDNQRNNDYIEDKRIFVNDVDEKPRETISIKDSRVTDITRHFMEIPNVREIFKKSNPEALEKIDQIIRNM